MDTMDLKKRSKTIWATLAEEDIGSGENSMKS
jgi:hypothetical protein